MLLTLFPVFYAFCNPFDINDLETAFKTVLICLFGMHINTETRKTLLLISIFQIIVWH